MPQLKKENISAPDYRCSELFRHIPELIEALEELYPAAECALEHGGSPWRLLVMSILFLVGQSFNPFIYFRF